MSIKFGTDTNNYVLKKKNGKIKADMYNYESARFGEPAMYYKGGKPISKAKFNKAVKTTKKVRLKEHFPEREL